MRKTLLGVAVLVLGACTASLADADGTDRAATAPTPQQVVSARSSVSAEPKVEICHVPPGNPENAHTITVAASAVPAHLAHGDLLGACLARWFPTCGDYPVCLGWRDKGLPLCMDEIEGDPCGPIGANCDLVDPCNSVLVCALEDPRPDPCPISRRTFKTTVRYLDEERVDELRRVVTEIRLATWEPSRPGAAPGERLGFIIDDSPSIPAVAGDHVDLYAYASMAVAAIQAQQREITALRREVAELRSLVRDGEAPERAAGK